MPQDLVPKKAIIFYESDEEKYAEVHRIVNGKFQEGRPLKRKELKTFAEIASTEKNVEKKTKQYVFAYRQILSISSNVAEDVITWIVPAGKYKLLFDGDVRGLKDGEYYLPNLIFRSNGSKVDVWAIKLEDLLNLNPNTQLYNGPFMNTNSVGNVCMGSAKIKKFSDWNDLIKQVEHSFFVSKFTHGGEGNVKGPFVKAFKNQKDRFDEDLLIPSIQLRKLNENS